ncbi:MAG: type II secretion system protein [Deltaproteobacteria bacterium]|nr:type II secretion system protein [Deltaproteobacteria bacterium]
MRGRRGFTLLEVVIALGIMTVAMTGLLTLFGRSQVDFRITREITVATMLARQKMAEATLEIEKRMQEGRVPQDAEHEEGEFAAPFESYRWQLDIRKVELPVPEQAEKADLMQLFMQQIAKQIAEAVREVKLTVVWKAREQERLLTVTTHMVNL